MKFCFGLRTSKIYYIYKTGFSHWITLMCHLWKPQHTYSISINGQQRVRLTKIQADSYTSSNCPWDPCVRGFLLYLIYLFSNCENRCGLLVSLTFFHFLFPRLYLTSSLCNPTTFPYLGCLTRQGISRPAGWKMFSSAASKETRLHVYKTMPDLTCNCRKHFSLPT